MDKLDLLGNLGLSEKEAKTYLAILELGSSTVKPIADRAGIKRTSIYNFIDRLVEQGLVTRTLRKGRTCYQGQSPSRLIEISKERLEACEDALPEFMGLFNLSGKKPRMHFFEGPEQMKNIVREEPKCKKEVLYIWPGTDIMEMIGGVRFMTEIDRQRIDAGVTVRTIRWKTKDILFRTSSHGPKYLRELRFAGEGMNFKMGMGIYDTGKISFFSSRHEGFGILIESRELEELMRALWNLFWVRCTPARPGEG